MKIRTRARFRVRVRVRARARVGVRVRLGVRYLKLWAPLFAVKYVRILGSLRVRVRVRVRVTYSWLPTSRSCDKVGFRCKR